MKFSEDDQAQTQEDQTKEMSNPFVPGKSSGAASRFVLDSKCDWLGLGKIEYLCDSIPNLVQYLRITHYGAVV